MIDSSDRKFSPHTKRIIKSYLYKLNKHPCIETQEALNDILSE